MEKGGLLTDIADEAAFMHDQIEESFRTWKHDALKVEWYGGEPLMEPGILEDLSRRFMDIAKSHSALHKDNLSGFEELCDLAEEISSQTGNTIRLMPANVEITPRVEKKDHHVVPVSSEELEWAYKHSGYAAKKDAFHPKRMFCRGTDPFGFIIDEKGLVFPNCNNHAEDKKNAFGSLAEDGSMEDIYRKSFAHARSWSFSDDSADCKSCRMLICCNGGCPSRAYERGRHFCLERVSDPESYAIMRYHNVFDGHENHLYNNSMEVKTWIRNYCQS